MEFKTISDQYLESDSFKALEHSSQEMYRSSIRRLNTFGDSVYTGIRSLPVSNSTKNSYMRVSNAIYSWAFTNRIIDRNPLTGIRRFPVTKDLPDVYTKREIETVWARAPRKYRHEAALLRVGFYTGCRVSELLNITQADIEGPYISIMGAKRREKGTVSRKVKITHEVRECLPTLLKEGYSKGIDNVRYKTRRMLGMIGVEYKQLRNTRSGLATAMFKAGYDIAVIAGQLGHKNLSTTQRYIRPTMEEMAERFKGI